VVLNPRSLAGEYLEATVRACARPVKFMNGSATERTESNGETGRRRWARLDLSHIRSCGGEIGMCGEIKQPAVDANGEQSYI